MLLCSGPQPGLRHEMPLPARGFSRAGCALATRRTAFSAARPVCRTFLPPPRPRRVETGGRRSRTRLRRRQNAPLPVPGQQPGVKHEMRRQHVDLVAPGFAPALGRSAAAAAARSKPRGRRSRTRFATTERIPRCSSVPGQQPGGGTKYDARAWVQLCAELHSHGRSAATAAARAKPAAGGAGRVCAEDRTSSTIAPLFPANAGRAARNTTPPAGAPSCRVARRRSGVPPPRPRGDRSRGPAAGRRATISHSATAQCQHGDGIISQNATSGE